MPTLYVENVPAEIYEALRQRARAGRKSIAAEVLSLLEQNVVTAAEKKARQRFFRELHMTRPPRRSRHPTFPSTEEMQRDDRER